MFYNVQREEAMPMRGRPCSCAFTGHRPGKLPWGEDENDLRCIALKAKLRAAVGSAIHEGWRILSAAWPRAATFTLRRLCWR